MKKILVINGPNLNLLGLREPALYGAQNFETLQASIREWAVALGLEVELFQSNHEGVIVDKIQAAYGVFDGILINPAAYTHTSVAIHDVLEIIDIPKVEVHLSEVDSREEYRKINFVRDVVDVTFQGEKEGSYLKGLGYLKNKLNVL
jgi:3-dehydroquinate dehydratase-2